MSRLADFFSGKRWRSARPVVTAEQRQAITAWQQMPAADLTGTHKSTRYVIVDVETSGLNMKKDRLISIGAVALVDGCIDFRDAFQVVLRQDQVSAHSNILIHGIGGSAQSQGVEPVDALLAFLRYIGRSPLVAYHAFFDQTMIDKAMFQYLGMKLDHTWLDLAWVLPELFKYRTGTRVALDDWLQLFAIENIVRHNAVSDAYATAKLMQVAIARGMQNGFDSPRAFLEIEKERRWMHEGR
jgi:DNA polymerase-3 subunit epsilon